MLLFRRILSHPPPFQLSLSFPFSHKPRPKSTIDKNLIKTASEKLKAVEDKSLKLVREK